MTLSTMCLFTTLSITVTSAFMLSVAFFHCYAECHYAEFRYAECRYAECQYAECRYAECGSAIKHIKMPLLILLLLPSYYF
jgi:hypothetical protein